MTVAAYVGHLVTPGATGNQDVTNTTPGGGGTALPDLSAESGSWLLVMFALGVGGTEDSAGPGLNPGIGFTANPGGVITARACCADARDQKATDTDTGRRTIAASITAQFQSGTTFFVDEATLTSMLAGGGFRLNWTTRDGSGVVRIGFVLFTGLTAATVGDYTSPGSATTLPVTTTGVDLTNNGHVFLATALSASLASAVGGYFGIGMANSYGEQWANSIGMQDTVATTNNSRYQRSNKCVAAIKEGEVVGSEADMLAMASGSFTLNFTTDTAATIGIFAACQGLGSFLGTITAGASPQTVTHLLGSVPVAAILSTVSAAASTSGRTGAAHAMGATDATNQRAYGTEYVDNDATASAEAKMRWTTGKSLYDYPPTGAGASDYEMSLGSFGGGSFVATHDFPASDEALFAVFGERSSSRHQMVMS